MQFRQLIGTFHRHGMKSYHIVAVARSLGIRISTKTVVKTFTWLGLKVASVGRWDKTSKRIRWKNRGWEARCFAIAKCFAAWCSYADAGLGEMDYDSIAKGEKPP